MISRLLAGLLPGFFLAVCLTSALCWLWPGDWRAAFVPAMLCLFPLWIGIVSACMVAHSAARAWTWTTAPAIAGLLALGALQRAGWWS